MDYKNFAKEIIDIVGSEKNIQSLVHCATRLRFTLVDESKVHESIADNHKSILSVVKKGGQYQLVIGNNVDKVYNEIMNIIKIDRPARSQETKQSIVNKMLSTITGSIAPVIPILAGAGMGKVLLIVLSLLGWLEKSSQTYYILNFIFDTGFYFLPVFIGFSAAKMFNCNQYLAAFVCLAMVHPSWSALLKAKEAVEFIYLPVALVKYSSQLVPALLTVWAMSHIERIVYKVVPEMVKVFLAPLLVFIITTPIALIMIGPVASFLAQIVANAIMFLQEHIGFIAIPILVAVYPWLVSIGMHKALSPITVMLVEQRGFDPIIRVIALCSNMSQAAASLAVSIKSKNKELKQLAFSASITAFFGGITEPAMYGVNLKLKKPMYACMVGGGVAGLFSGIVKLKAFVYATPGLLSLPMWVSDVDNQIVNAVITLIIASIVTFIATFIIGFDDPIGDPDEKIAEDITKKKNSSIQKQQTKAVELISPLEGEVLALTDVNDETFSSGVMGKGVAIKPSKGSVIAPGNATVTATFHSNHAIGLTLENDIEMLIHVGVDTVTLQGKYFTTKVAKGQQVKQGDVLLEFDLEALKLEEFDLSTVVVITNSNDYLDVVQTKEKTVSSSTTLLTVF